MQMDPLVANSGVQTMKKIAHSTLFSCFIFACSAFVSVSAMTHADICAANRAQCIKGCDGMAQCTRACEINYQKCMQAGQDASVFIQALHSSRELAMRNPDAHCRSRMQVGMTSRESRIFLHGD